MSVPEANSIDRDLYSVPETRHKLGGISQSKFYELVKEGHICISKIGKRSFVSANEIQRFVENLGGPGNG